MKRKIIRSLLVGAVVLLCAVAALHLYRFLDGPFNDRAFDAALWKQCHSSGCGLKNPRAQMVEDLKNRLLLPAQPQLRPTRAEVISLLGPPDDEQTSTYVSYRIGTWSSLMEMDSDVLIISFDQAGRVERVGVQTT